MRMWAPTYLRVLLPILAVVLIFVASPSPESGAAPPAVDRQQPIAVSPGNTESLAPIGEVCPTFLWGGIEGAVSYELVVFPLSDDADDDAELTPVLRRTLPGTAPGFTPTLDQRFEPGAAYAWMLRAQTADGPTDWSEPALFRVANAPTRNDVEQALDVLRLYLQSADQQPSGETGPPESFGVLEGLASHAEPTDPDGAQPVASPLITPPDKTAVRAQLPDTTGVIFGLHALSNSTTNGSAAVVAESTAASGNVAGLQAQTSSAAGAAGIFDNTATGDVLRGQVNGATVFTVNGSGNVAAVSFTGGGSGLTSVDADTLDGLDSTAFHSSTTDDWVDETGDTMTGTLTLSPVSGDALVTTAGQVGIGKTPAYPLDVVGNVNITVGLLMGGLKFLHAPGTNGTATGTTSLSSNTTGARNTAIGNSSLSNNTSGSYNTATGNWALLSNIDGDSNTGIGHYALRYNTTGSGNVAIGDSAGEQATTGDNNIFISNTGVAADAGKIKIGTDGTHSATYIQGIHGVTVTSASTVLIQSNGQLGTVSSSRRFKEDIEDMNTVSDRLQALRPVTFRFKQEASSGERPVEFGLIAEEVAEVFPELVVYDDDGRPFTVQYHLLSTLLLNELQKQHRHTEQQEQEIQRLQDRLDALEAIARLSHPHTTSHAPTTTVSTPLSAEIRRSPALPDL